jgi:hypothetical protein
MAAFDEAFQAQQKPRRAAGLMRTAAVEAATFLAHFFD